MFVRRSDIFYVHRFRSVLSISALLGGCGELCNWQRNAIIHDKYPFLRAGTRLIAGKSIASYLHLIMELYGKWSNDSFFALRTRVISNMCKIYKIQYWSLTLQFWCWLGCQSSAFDTNKTRYINVSMDAAKTKTAIHIQNQSCMASRLCPTVIIVRLLLFSAS